MRSIKIVVAILLLSLTLSAKERVNINFDNISINDLIKIISKITNKNIIQNYDIKGSVNLVTTQAVYDDEVLDILISILHTKRYTLVDKGNMLEVVKVSEAVKHAPMLVKNGSKSNLIQTQIIKLKNQSATSVVTKVRQFLSAHAKLVTMKETNTIIVSDYAKNIEMIKSVINVLEKKNENIVKIIEIKYSNITQLYKDATSISKNLFNANIQNDVVNIYANKDTNSLVLVGTKTNVDKLSVIVKNLDKERDLNKSLRVFTLKNSVAKNVLTTVNNIITKQTYTDKTQQPLLSLSEEINSIIVMANPTMMRGIEKIINELDREKYQVYVQAQIIEINRNKTEKLGLQYGFAGGNLTPSGLYAISSTLNSSVSTLMSNAASVIENTLTSTITGATKSALALGASLDFLHAKGVANTVSTPSILCLDNIKSNIKVGKQVSLQAGSTIANGTTTNTLNREEVGLTLTIQPRVSSIHKVALDVKVELESFTGTVTNNQPDTNKQEVQTQAILRNGESIIVGGLVKTFNTNAENKVPFFGDIPILGAAFRHDSIVKEQDNLIVILTPYIVESSDQLSQLQIELGELDRLQKEYNKKVIAQLDEEAKARAKAKAKEKESKKDDNI
jgi:general secretion pathway protein D